jgi:hypothetical protein
MIGAGVAIVFVIALLTLVSYVDRVIRRSANFSPANFRTTSIRSSN